MPDIFISHSTTDREMAERIQRFFPPLGVSSFLAPISIEAGAKWSEGILMNLKQARIVLFLASKAACESAFVNQELGGSLAMNKRIIPVVWNMSPEDLPGWVKQYQAIDLREKPGDIQNHLAKIAVELRLDNFKGGVILAVIAAVLVWAAASG